MDLRKWAEWESEKKQSWRTWLQWLLLLIHQDYQSSLHSQCPCAPFFRSKCVMHNCVEHLFFSIFSFFPWRRHRFLHRCLSLMYSMMQSLASAVRQKSIVRRDQVKSIFIYDYQKIIASTLSIYSLLIELLIFYSFVIKQPVFQVNLALKDLAEVRLSLVQFLHYTVVSLAHHY